MDFVILWVDDKDPKWREEYEKYSLLEEGEKRVCRFRDWENLHYWFRGVEKFAPWVDRVFLITAGQVPSWLNTNHPKLRLVFHEEYIPKELLPTFCSGTIELFLHKIPDLSEHFVLFNDDFFIINKIKPERFFIKGLPVDMSAMNVPVSDGEYFTSAYHLSILNRHFNKSEVFRKDLFNWFNIYNGKHLVRTLLLCWWPRFVGFYDHHLPQPFLKSIFKEVWAVENDKMIKSVTPRFRQGDNITQYLFRYWQLASARFICRNVYADATVFHQTSLNEREIDNAVKIIRKQKKNIVVINDSISAEFNFENSRQKINDAFESILPEKSSFEKPLKL